MKSKARNSCPNCAVSTPTGPAGPSGAPGVPGGRKVLRTSKASMLARLRRTEGQLRGITRMLEEDRYCVDVLVQLSAARSALDAAAMQLLKEHLGSCVKTALTTGRGEASVQEITEVLRKFIR